MASESSSDIELKVLHANTVVNHVVRTLQVWYTSYFKVWDMLCIE